LSQHTPSGEQKPLAQSSGRAQALPAGTLPQRWLTQGAPVQSLSVAQELAQVLPAVSHLYGAQAAPVGTTHIPLPSQRPSPVAVLPVQFAGWHEVPDGCRWHWPAPSHTPVVPQVEAGC
jgi:hypothetical protein